MGWKHSGSTVITRNQNPTTGATLQYSFTLLYLHLLATMLTLELHYKNLKIYQTLTFVLVFKVTLSAVKNTRQNWALFSLLVIWQLYMRLKEWPWWGSEASKLHWLVGKLEAQGEQRKGEQGSVMGSLTQHDHKEHSGTQSTSQGKVLQRWRKFCMKNKGTIFQSLPQMKIKTLWDQAQML